MDTLTLQDLQPFCSTDHTRDVLRQPFSDGEHTYATDGRILARVEGWVQGANVPVSGNWASLLRSCREISQAAVDRPLGHFWPFPQPSPEPAADWRPCESCEGKGCEDCDLEGRENLAKPHYDALFRTVFNVAWLNRLWLVGAKLPGGLVCAAGAANSSSRGKRTLLLRGAQSPVAFVLMPVVMEVNETPRLIAQHYDQDPELLPPAP